MNIITIVGARPQFIKAVMISQAIADHNRRSGCTQIKETIIHTGQHYDRDMSDIFFRELNIAKPAVNLKIGSGSHGETTGRMLADIENELINRRPDRVIVYGDTNSTLAGALAAAKLHIPVAHVEAGLRSFNRRMPEEINRILTDHVADMLFCPTDAALSNLASEGIIKGVYQVGDVMYDAAIFFSDIAEKKSTILEKHNLCVRKYALATVHRAENTDDDLRLANIMEGLVGIGKREYPVIFPLHPRTRQALKRIGYSVPAEDEKEHIVFINPVSFLDMMMLEKNSGLILTDSGGVQKEAFFHKVPCITLRCETEWVETVEFGWNQLAGTDKDAIIKAGNYAESGKVLNCYGDGKAGLKIIECLLKNDD